MFATIFLASLASSSGAWTPRYPDNDHSECRLWRFENQVPLTCRLVSADPCQQSRVHDPLFVSGHVSHPSLWMPWLQGEAQANFNITPQHHAITPFVIATCNLLFQWWRLFQPNNHPLHVLEDETHSVSGDKSSNVEFFAQHAADSLNDKLSMQRDTVHRHCFQKLFFLKQCHTEAVNPTTSQENKEDKPTQTCYMVENTTTSNNNNRDYVFPANTRFQPKPKTTDGQTKTPLRSYIIVDTGAQDNLCGSEWANNHLSILEECQLLDNVTTVDNDIGFKGVGDNVQTSEVRCQFPIALQLQEKGKHGKGNTWTCQDFAFDAQILDHGSSHLPALMGYATLERIKARINLDNPNYLHMCFMSSGGVPCEVQLFRHLGHLILPCDFFRNRNQQHLNMQTILNTNKQQITSDNNQTNNAVNSTTTAEPPAESALPCAMGVNHSSASHDNNNPTTIAVADDNVESALSCAVGVNHNSTSTTTLTSNNQP